MRLRLLLPLALLALPACSPSPSGPVLAGVEVADPALLAADTRERIPELLADRSSEVEVAPAASCYFARRADGSFLDSMFCGPVSRQYGSGPWLELPVDFSGDRHRVSGVLAAAVDAPADVALVGPAGERPPSDTYLPPPPVAVGSVLTRSQLPPSLLMTSRSGWTLRSPGPAGSVSSPAISVASSATTGSLGSGYERLTAPSGSSLLVLELVRREDIAAGDVAFKAGESDAVSLGVLERFVVMVVPDTVRPQLRLSASGLVQSLDLSDGSSSGSAPRLWNDTPQVSIEPSDPEELLFAVPVPRLLDRSVSGDLSVSASFTVSAETPVLRSPSGRTADPGFLLLPVRVHDVRLSSPSRYVDLSLSVTPYLLVEDELVLPQYDEESLPASQVRMFLQVPEDTEVLPLRLQVDLLWWARSFSGDESGIVSSELLERDVELSWGR